ncbi:WGR domain-containing protein [Puniceibacterium sp. IMCC21224]|uniref:WGR domain-containing protein n=1 Tax=Puniceibacterium sp. IMCC21224 TaxID=1618204 RepID=UPI00065DB14E|nr:WGR domain-containing protein [Puniceibacterium sp. IMCC21224]KMK64166.1 hypothetical protein IMCC21224_15144 [Puniceibacterium sp. IMCC21224]
MYHSPIQLDVFPTDVQMRRIDPARNMRRFYRLSVQRDLFGRASLVRECVFRGDAPTDSDLMRPPVPISSAHRFRGIRPPL